MLTIAAIIYLIWWCFGFPAATAKLVEEQEADQCGWDAALAELLKEKK